jgi:hypothetical protein
LQTICKGRIEFAVSRKECRTIRDLYFHPKNSGLYGDRFMLSTAKAAAKTAAKTAAKNVIKIQLSQREQRIIERLDKDNEDRSIPR